MGINYLLSTNYKLLSRATTALTLKLLTFVKLSLLVYKDNKSRLAGTWQQNAPLNYDFKFYIKIYWFFCSILHYNCFFTSSIKGLENKKHQGHFFIHVCYFHYWSFFMVSLWNNHIWLTNNTCKCSNFNFIIVYFAV